MCSNELEFGCAPETATCQGRFHQMKDSVVGLTVDTSRLNENSFCGPFGKCQGSVDVHTKVSHAPPGAKIFCEMQRYPGAKDIDGKGWESCEAEVDASGDAQCSMDMPAKLPPSANLEGKCVVT